MRERAITTSIIWIALAIATGLLLNSVRYTELVVNPIDQTKLIEQTAFASTPWQIGTGILIFLLIMCAMAGTLAIWQGTTTNKEHNAHEQTEKVKRDEREARIKRLLATMDDEDLDLLEGGQLGDDGERQSLESLLKRHG